MHLGQFKRCIMANDLSTPLTGRKRRSDAPRHFPLARILFALIFLLVGGFIARITLVDDPTGGRPSHEIAIASSSNANSLAEELRTGPVTISVDPQQYPAGSSFTTITPDTAPGMSIAAMPDLFGALPDLSEETSIGKIPRIATTGQTPFQAYARPLEPRVAASTLPKVAIVVTGLGINEQGSLDTIDQLPDIVTLAFAPYGKTLTNSVAAARAAGHEVLLEIPLEPFDFPQNDPGPHTLLTGDQARANIDKLFWLMARFGGYVGVINNMGARFTASAADFSPVMEEIGARGLGYLDDGSSSRSLAPQLAAGNKVPFAKSELIIDTNPSRQAILAALASLEAKALENGQAIGIISALPISVGAIAEWSQTLAEKGIDLVPASALMK
jgi:polysaccharide deacetylase 2 family uncharacterized protein YibQ